MKTVFKVTRFSDVVSHPVIPGKNGHIRVLDVPFSINVVFDCGEWVRIIIPKGFAWDGASIPWWAYSIIRVTPGGSMLLPSLVHDALYRTAGLRKGHGQGGVSPFERTSKLNVSRKFADQLFWKLMVMTGAYSKAQRATCYSVVRMFGKIYWGGDAPNVN